MVVCFVAVRQGGADRAVGRDEISQGVLPYFTLFRHRFSSEPLASLVKKYRTDVVESQNKLLDV